MEEREYQGHIYRRNAPGEAWQMVGPVQRQDGVPAFVPGAPKPVDPIEIRRLELSEQSNSRANAASERAATAAERQATIGERQIGKDLFDQASRLRDDYNQDATVKGFLRALPAYTSALEAADGSPAGDLALTYSFATIMDPNSAVREGEQAMVSGSDTIYGKTVAWLKNQMGREGTFSPELRRDLLKRMRSRAAEQRRVYDSQRNTYSERAQRAGLNPLDVVGEDPARQFGLKELEFWASQGEQEAAAELSRRGGDDTSGRDVSVDRGSFSFSDQAPETVIGYRLNDAQEQQIGQAIQVGDEGQALALLRKMTGYEPTPETRESVRSAIKRKGRLSFDYTSVDEAEKARLRALNALSDELSGKPSDIGMLASQGGGMGFADEVAGAGGALGAILTGGDVGKAYNTARDATLQRLDDIRGRQGWVGTGAEVAGGLAAPVGALGKAVQGANLLARVGQGARAGAIGGALAGAGYSEGQNRLLGAGLGATAGGALGSAIPVAGQVISNRVGGLRRLLGRDPELPRRLVGEAIGADGSTPRAVGNALQQASERGSPMSIADTGDNARQLLASVGRQPGPSRTLARETVIERQLAQQERIAQAVVRDLGPTANIRETSDALIDQARTAAKPHYEAFEAAPGASSVKIDDLLTRPSVKKGIERAYRLAAEEGEDPTALGFTLNQAGEPELTRVPSFKTLDYVKQGLDDVVETYRDKTTGVLKLDGEGRKINRTLRTLINRVDAVNPAYKAAREAYAGPAKLEEALQKGAKALSRAPDDLSAEIARMTDPEKEMYRLGLRKSITDFLESRTDSGDKVQALIGTPKKRAALARAFGGRAEYERFIATLGDEAQMGQTYRAVTGNSSTAERLAFDQTTSDTGLAETAMDAALRGGKDGMWSATVAAVQKLRDVGRFGAGEAGQRTRESVAALLTETDPAALAELVRAAQRAQALQRVRSRGSANPRRAVASGVGNQLGGALGARVPAERSKK